MRAHNTNKGTELVSFPHAGAQHQQRQGIKKDSNGKMVIKQIPKEPMREDLQGIIEEMK